jgi:hypothetical protein
MTTGKTDRAEYYFKVAEFGDGKAWIALELRKAKNLPCLGDGFLGLDLRDPSYHHAKDVADFLNENIISVSHTLFVPDIDQKEPF